MAEGVRRIQDVESPAELLGVRRAEQQITHQRFPRAAIFLPMLNRALLALLAVPAIAGLTLVAVRLTPGPQRDGTTLLPSGWRIHPAGRQVDVGTLPLNVVTLSDGSVLVTNNGYGGNGLMRIDPLPGSGGWRLPRQPAGRPPAPS